MKKGIVILLLFSVCMTGCKSKKVTTEESKDSVESIGDMDMWTENDEPISEEAVSEPESEPESKHDSKSESETASKPESKPVPETENKTEIKNETIGWIDGDF